MVRAKIKELLIYAFILILQVAFIIYWANIKTNYNIDELYSIGYASSLTGLGEGAEYITTSPEFRIGEWMHNSELKKHLVQSDIESIFNAPIGRVMDKFIKGRNYYCFLNASEAIIGNRTISVTAGVFLNIICMIIAELMLALLMKRMNIDQRIRILAVAMFGFSVYVISACVFVRFYMLIIMIMLIVLNCFYNIWDAVSWRKIVFSEILILALLYLSFRNSEFTVPFFGAFMGCFIIALITQKKKRQLISCIVLCAAGVLYVAITTDFIEILFRPDDYTSLQNVWVNAGLTVHDTTIGTFGHYILFFIKLLLSHFFGRGLIFALLGVITVYVIVLTKKGGEKIGNSIRSLSLSSDTFFILVIAGEALICMVFNALCQYDVWRYYCFSVVSCAILFWYMIDRALKCSFFVDSSKHIILVLAGYVILVSVLPFVTRNIEYTYESEKSFIDDIHKEENLDVIMVLPANIETIRVEQLTYLSRHAIYDCVHLMPEDTMIFVSDLDKYSFEQIDYPDRFLLWTQKYQDEIDISPVLNDLNRNGYDVQELGTDHDSLVYLVQKG